MAESTASVVVFAGPSLFGVDRRWPDFDIRAPACRGDVYRAGLLRPRAIALIDGYFDQTPSVWHKEILHVLASGTPVVGAASLGALRAVELAPFGMRGVGQVYQLYATGQLEDDDEVAITHADAQGLYRPLTVAMVDIRATLAVASAAGVVSPSDREGLLAVAKGLHFTDRSYPRLLASFDPRGLGASSMARLEVWLAANTVHRKREDAIALLDRLAAGDPALFTPPDAGFIFQRTRVWEALRGRIDLREPRTSPEASRGVGALEISAAVWRGALLRATAQENANRQRVKVDQAILDHFVERFRRERNLLTAEAFDRWMEANGLRDEQAILAFFENELLFQSLCARVSAQARAFVPSELRASGLYPRSEQPFKPDRPPG